MKLRHAPSESASISVDLCEIRPPERSLASAATVNKLRNVAFTKDESLPLTALAPDMEIAIATALRGCRGVWVHIYFGLTPRNSTFTKSCGGSCWLKATERSPPRGCNEYFPNRMSSVNFLVYQESECVDEGAVSPILSFRFVISLP